MFAWVFYALLIVFDGGSSIAAHRFGGRHVHEALPWLRNPYVHVGVKIGGLPVLVKIDRKLGRRSRTAQYIARGLVAGLAIGATARNIRSIRASR